MKAEDVRELGTEENIWAKAVGRKRILKKIAKCEAYWFILLCTKYQEDDQIKDNLMGGTCGTCWWGGNAYGVRWGKLKERVHLVNLNMEGRKLMWSQRSRMGGRGPGYEQLAICCVDGNELSGSIKCREFLDYLRIY